MLEQLARLGRVGLGALERLGRAHLLISAILGGLPSLIARPLLLLVQTYSIGVLSVVIIVVSGVFVGMVLGLQGYYNDLRREE